MSVIHSANTVSDHSTETPMQDQGIETVIFDMDGVLIDAKEWHYEALNKALGLFGFMISRHDHLVTYDGLPTRKKLEMLTIERGLPKGLHRFINEMKQIYTAELITLKCRPTFAHQYALSRLKASGLKLALASNSMRATVDSMLARASLATYFDVTLSNEDVTHPKPDPEIYQRVMERLGTPPARCLIIEDNENGVKAANAAGAHVMHVASVDDVRYDAIKDAMARIGGTRS